LGVGATTCNISAVLPALPVLWTYLKEYLVFIEILRVMTSH